MGLGRNNKIGLAQEGEEGGVFGMGIYQRKRDIRRVRYVRKSVRFKLGGLGDGVNKGKK